MSKTFHLRHDLKVKTFSIPPADIDRLKADDATILAHGFIVRPAWHPKLSALWERAVKGISSFAEPRLHLSEHGVLRRRAIRPQTGPGAPGASGADFNAPRNVQLGWVSASFVIPSLNPPGAGSGPTAGGESIIMGVSLNRNTGSLLYGGVYWDSANSSLGDPTYRLFLEYQTSANPQWNYGVFIDTTVRITSGTSMYLYLSASASADGSGSTSNMAHLVYQAGGQAAVFQHSLVMPSAVAPFTGATDAAWTVEDTSLLPDYGEVDFEGASTGTFCSASAPSATYEPSPSDAWNDGTLSTGSVSNGTVTCRYHVGG